MKVVVKEMRQEDAFGRELTLEVPADEVTSQVSAAIDDLRRDLALPGFRKGKVPRSVVESRFGREVRAEVVRRLLGEALWEALHSEHLHPIGEPEVSRVEDKDGEPLRFRARVDVRPHIEPGDPAQITVQKVVHPTTEEEIDRVIANLRERLARLEPADRPVAAGDVVTIDIAELGPGQVPIIGRRQPDARVELTPEAVPESWIAALGGRRVGDSAVVEVPPREGEVHEPGAARYLELALKKVEAKLLPELDDDFARLLARNLIGASEVTDLAGLRAHIRGRLEADEELRATRAVEREILDRLAAGAKLEIPERLVRAAADRMYEGALRDYPDLDQAARERVAVEARDAAVHNIRRELMVTAVAEAKGLEVSQEEAEAEYRRLERAGRRPADGGRSGEPAPEATGSERADRVERLRDVLVERKVLKYLADTADVQRVEQSSRRKRIVTPYDP
jgi:trigger factor